MFAEIEPLWRKRSGAPDTATIYKISVINDQQIMLEGATPTGKRRDGRDRWTGAKPTYQCVVSAVEYDRAVARMKAKKAAPSSEPVSA